MDSFEPIRDKSLSVEWRCVGGIVKTFENRLPVKPRKKWDSVEQYVEYLRHFMAYRYVKKFVKDKSVLEIGCGTGYGANYLSQSAY